MDRMGRDQKQEKEQYYERAQVAPNMREAGSRPHTEDWEGAKDLKKRHERQTDHSKKQPQVAAQTSMSV